MVIWALQYLLKIHRLLIEFGQKEKIFAIWNWNAKKTAKLHYSSPMCLLYSNLRENKIR